MTATVGRGVELVQMTSVAPKEPKPEAKETFDNIAYRSHRWDEKQTILFDHDKMECEWVDGWAGGWMGGWMGATLPTRNVRVYCPKVRTQIRLI